MRGSFLKNFSYPHLSEKKLSAILLHVAEVLNAIKEMDIHPLLPPQNHKSPDGGFCGFVVLRYACTEYTIEKEFDTERGNSCTLKKAA